MHASNLELFAYGCIGGALTLAITQMLPAAITAAKSGHGPSVTWWRISGVIVVVAVFVVAGGVAGILVAGDAKSGIAAGMGWQALLAGAIKTGKAAAG